VAAIQSIEITLFVNGVNWLERDKSPHPEIPLARPPDSRRPSLETVIATVGSDEYGVVVPGRILSIRRTRGPAVSMSDDATRRKNLTGQYITSSQSTPSQLD